MTSISTPSSSSSSITTFFEKFVFFFSKKVIHFENKTRKLRKTNICEHSRLHFISHIYSVLLEKFVSKVNQITRR